MPVLGSFNGSFFAGRRPAVLPRGSILFDGSSQYLTLPREVSGQITNGDFTIEMFLYAKTQTSTYPTLLSNFSSYSGPVFQISFNHNGDGKYSFWPGTASSVDYGSVAAAATEFFEYGSIASSYDSSIDYGTLIFFSSPLKTTATVRYNEWNHLAVVRSSGTVKIYLDGVAAPVSDTTYDNILGNGANLYIGTLGSDITNGYFNGYVTNIRIVDGTAVYTSDFTPPTEALEPIPNTILLLQVPDQTNYLRDISDNAQIANNINGAFFDDLSPFPSI